VSNQLVCAGCRFTTRRFACGSYDDSQKFAVSRQLPLRPAATPAALPGMSLFPSLHCGDRILAQLNNQQSEISPLAPLQLDKNVADPCLIFERIFLQ
jgi:hypothetical protein